MRSSRAIPVLLGAAALALALGVAIQAAGPETAAPGSATAYIPPQCYTQTAGASGSVHNTCYTCHRVGFRPDFVNDADFQLRYDFAAPAERNPWTNLFKDRRGQIAGMDDAAIRAYVRQSNYLDDRGGPILARALAQPPAAWDADGDGRWAGYVPDAHFRFDAAGFDRDPAGGYTGWRAYASYPFPSTHWPANGSFADTLIRLPEPFRTRDGRFDLATYTTNLAILEALIKRRDVAIPETDEAALGVDLDKDGRLGRATRVAFDWAPTAGRTMRYVGDAGRLQAAGKVHLAAGLYPEGTEFLNTLRYLDVGPDGRVGPAPRMKEVRHLRKRRWLTYAEHETLAMNEIKEKNDFPDRLRLPVGDRERGLSNGRGWVAHGFIEDAAGALRPQTVEETLSCVGCHGGTGATTDSTFSLARKLDAPAAQAGWFHWSQRGLEGLNEPKVEFRKAGVQYEYSFYLAYAGAGDEFRANREIADRFLDARGVLRQDMAERLHEDISILLLPSPQRAVALNKAYKAIVEEQGFVLGREALVEPAVHVHQELKAADRETRVSDPVVLAEHPRDFPAPPAPAAADAGETLRRAVLGNGMAGPSGERYGINWAGQIDESTYAVDRKGFYFPFPPRHTLPARIIVPNGSMASCYECHRLPSPMPPRDPRVTIPVPLPQAAEETGVTRLTRDPGVDQDGVFSPDGAWIAWVSDRSQSYQVWVMRRDGSEPRRLTSGPAIHGWPRWSPDGRRLAYWGHDPASGQSTIEVLDVSSGAAVTLAASRESLDRPAWRPDGEYVAYGAQTDGNWDIWVATADGSRRYRLTHDAQMETNPLWSPDGTVIAYKVAPNKEYNLTVEHFLSVSNGFEAPTYRLWDGIKSIQMSDWSPDGKRIAYTAEMVTNASGEDRVSYLAVVNEVALTGSRTAGRPITLSGGATLGDRGPVFSPTGDRIAFWSWDRAYRATLWVANADGSGLRRLTSAGMDMVPRWSPDGKAILFESGRSGNLDLWTVAVD